MDRDSWNKQVKHPLQSYEWGEFRQATGLKVVREGGIQVTIHPIPHTPWTIGYVPKGPEISDEQVMTLHKIVRDNSSIFIKLEPRVEMGASNIGTSHLVTRKMENGKFVEGRPLFTKYNFVLDVTPSEEELLKNMKQKTRYNLRIAEKRGVEVLIDNSPVAFQRYLELTKETTDRQGFYAHTPSYHKKMWDVLSRAGMAQIITATYGGKIITTWILFKFGDTLYYPYGASSREHREVMANNLVMWEAIRLAKKWGCKYLDMWGALGPSPDKNDPWYGFHKFKEGYGARHVEYVGTWDYVARPLLYRAYRIVEWARWKVLRLSR